MVEFLAWLTDVLERMVSGRTKTGKLEQLFPWTWNAEWRTATSMPQCRRPGDAYSDVINITDDVRLEAENLALCVIVGRC
jgi:hypothetical protein